MHDEDTIPSSEEAWAKYWSGPKIITVNGQPLSGVGWAFDNSQLIQLQQKLQEKESELNDRKREYLAELAKKDRDNAQLKKTQGDYERQVRLNHIYKSVSDIAQQRLLDDESFADLFTARSCFAYIISVDLRRSTDLMLKAVKPSLFAVFLRQLCDRLRALILNNHGVFDKFTGDGILAFFPNHYSGEDAGFFAVNAAAQCHQAFAEIYQENLDCFRTAPKDAGLGIGIDCGEVDLVTDLGGLTVVGPPVVYACRFGGAPAFTTFLNQQAYADIFKRYSAYFSFAQESLDVKNEGEIYAYRVEPNGKEYKPKLPSWLTTPVEGVKESTTT